MKRIIFVAIATAMLAACTQKDLYDPSANNQNYVETDLQNIVPTRSVKINVPAGQVAVVTNKVNGDTLAVLDGTRIVDLPTGLTGTRATRATNTYTINDFNVNVEYITGDQVSLMQSYMYYYNTVVFEDADNNDYDYNDLVFHTMMKFSPKGDRWGSTLKLQPIAFGAQNTIDLKAWAYLVSETGEKIDSLKVIDEKNVRKSMFLNDGTDFINTEKSQIEKDGGLTFYNLKFDNWFQFPAIATNQYVDIIYSIYVQETGKTYTSIPMTQRLAEKMTSTGKKYNTSFDKNNIPFGLVFSDIWGGRPFVTTERAGGAEWFIYPQEREPIEKVYPNFREWLSGKVSTVNWSTPKGNYINSIGDPDEKSLYDFTVKSKGGKYIVTRKNLTKFDITKFIHE